MNNMSSPKLHMSLLKKSCISRKINQRRKTFGRKKTGFKACLQHDDA